MAQRAMPHYTRRPRDESMGRAIVRQDVLQWFTRPGGAKATASTCWRT